LKEQLDVSRCITNAKLEALQKKKELQNNTEAESASYFSRALDRLKADLVSILEDELAEIGECC